jgi:hypothetical protein
MAIEFIENCRQEVSSYIGYSERQRERGGGNELRVIECQFLNSVNARNIYRFMWETVYTTEACYSVTLRAIIYCIDTSLKTRKHHKMGSEEIIAQVLWYFYVFSSYSHRLQEAFICR